MKNIKAFFKNEISATHVNTVNVKNLYKYVNICTQKLSLQNRKMIHKKICMKTFKQC